MPAELPVGASAERCRNGKMDGKWKMDWGKSTDMIQRLNRGKQHWIQKSEPHGTCWKETSPYQAGSQATEIDQDTLVCSVALVFFMWMGESSILKWKFTLDIDNFRNKMLFRQWIFQILKFKGKWLIAFLLVLSTWKAKSRQNQTQIKSKWNLKLGNYENASAPCSRHSCGPVHHQTQGCVSGPEQLASSNQHRVQLQAS